VSARTAPRHRGFLMMELAIGLVLAGALVALLIPLLAMQRTSDADHKDVAAMEQARAALLGQAVTGGGLPAPIMFETSVIDGQEYSSHLTLNTQLTTLPLGWAGALAGQALGAPHISSLQTAYWYDVQPALRSDAEYAFFPLVSGTGARASFSPIVQQFDPDLNTRLSTGGHRSQLCRNLNTLQAIEEAIRVEPTDVANPAGTNYLRDYINTTLPRVWGAGFESQFSWNSGLGYADVTLPVGATSLISTVFENSAAAAFVVVRRQPPAQRRLDRQNAVYSLPNATGLDKAFNFAVDNAYPPSVLSGDRGFRVYENSSTSTTDNATSDQADYAGLVRSVSLGEFAQSLRGAGLCTKPAEACKANQLFVRFSNSVRSAPPTGLPTGLPLRWSLMDDAEVTYQTEDVAQGTATNGVCLDAFATDAAGSAPARYLRLTFISPTGTVGYTTSPPWFENGLLVDPNFNPASAAASSWLALAALSATEAGKTVTVSCTGTHTVNAALPSGELVNAGPALPTCSVTQLP